MIPSKYVPKQLEFFVFSIQQRFLSRLRCSFWHGPLQFDSFAFCRSVDECWGSFENATNAFHLERTQLVHLILGQLYGFKSAHELGYDD